MLHQICPVTPTPVRDSQVMYVAGGKVYAADSLRSPCKPGTNWIHPPPRFRRSQAPPRPTRGHAIVEPGGSPALAQPSHPV